MYNAESTNAPQLSPIHKILSRSVILNIPATIDFMINAETIQHSSTQIAQGNTHSFRFFRRNPIMVPFKK